MQIASLIANKTPTSIRTEYSNFADVFSPKLALKLPKHKKIKDYTIKFVDNWQPTYRLIYSLGPVELEILKTYIKTNLANSFIRPSKSSAKTPIFFDKKLDKSL